MTKRSWPQSTLATLLLLAACATTPGQEGSGITVRVINNLIPPSPVTVYLVPSAGIEREIGTVISGSAQSLRSGGLSPVGEHRLIARASERRYIESNIIVLDNVTALEWDLASNFVRVLGTRPSSGR